MQRIRQLHIENFRGIGRSQPINLDGKDVIIFGNNGTGKSSLVDALEFHFTGRVARLTGRAGVKDRTAIPHLHTTDPVYICLTYSSGQPVVAGYPHKLSSIPKNLQNWYQLAQARPFILRRNQLLEFISAKPAERYQQISRLIGIEKLDKIERVWLEQLRRCKLAAQSAENNHNQRRNRLSELCGAPIYQPIDCLQAINQKLQTFGQPPATQRADLQDRHLALTQHVGQTAESVRDLPPLVYALGEQIETASTHYRTLLNKLDSLWQSEAAIPIADLMPLLTAALTHVQAHRPKNCPLCNQSAPPNLQAQLEAQLAQFTAIQSARDAVKQAQQAFERTRRTLLDNLTQLKARLAVAHLSEYDAALDAALQVVDELRQLTLDEPARQRPDTSALRRLYQQTLPLLADDLELRAKQPMVNDRQSAELNFAATLPRIDELWGQMLTTAQMFATADAQRRQVQIVYDSLVAARKGAVARLLRVMSADFERLYSTLHPHEGYGSIQLDVITNRRGSLDLRTDYQNQNAHPLNFLSEGHLDSLGLCIFLAFVKHFNDDLRLIVLDDVLTTIDADHRRRVVALLQHEFADYQLIMTTHDVGWARELVEMLPDCRRVDL